MRQIGALNSVVYSAGERRLFLAKKFQRGNKPGRQTMFRRSPKKKTQSCASSKTGLSRRSALSPDRNRETRPASTRYALPSTEKIRIKN